MFNGNPAYYKLALTIVSTIRGIPQLYYGSEIGMRGDKNKKEMQTSEEISRRLER